MSRIGSRMLYLITGATWAAARNCSQRSWPVWLMAPPAKDVFSAKAREVFIARPESKSRRIVTAQIRALEHALQMRAANGRRKVAIIPDADRLQTEAANAFLKTLEEPPKDSLLLLLSALPEALPETILSRCIAIPLASDGEPQSKKEEEKAREIAATSIPPNDLEYSICLSTCSGISTTAPSDT